LWQLLVVGFSAACGNPERGVAGSSNADESGAGGELNGGGDSGVGGSSCVSYTDISSSRGFVGQAPLSLIDPNNGKLLVAITETVNYGSSRYQRPSLIRCDLDGTGCTYADVSAGRSGLLATAGIDTDRGKLLVVIKNDTGWYTTGLIRCDLDGSGCTYRDISAADVGASWVGADPASGDVRVVVENRGLREPGLIRCDLGAGACRYWNISAGQGPIAYPTVVVDTASAKLLVVAENGADSYKLGMIRCNFDGTGCTYADISTGQLPYTGYRVILPMIDSINDKLMVVTVSSTSNAIDLPLALTRCELDGTGCSYQAIAPLRYDSSVYPFTSAVIDSVGSKLLIVTLSNDDHHKPVLYRCELDGTGCSYQDISAGQGRDSGWSPSAVIDSTARKLLVVTENGDNTYLPGLFSVCLQ
jgi:hypothetical protein